MQDSQQNSTFNFFLGVDIREERSVFPELVTVVLVPRTGLELLSLFNLDLSDWPLTGVTTSGLNGDIEGGVAVTFRSDICLGGEDRGSPVKDDSKKVGVAGADSGDPDLGFSSAGDTSLVGLGLVPLSSSAMTETSTGVLVSGAEIIESSLCCLVITTKMHLPGLP